MSDSVGARSGSRRRKKLGKKAETFPPIESFLPDDVVIDILSRLLTKDVLRCRCVCKKWRDVTSTRDFTDLHFQRSIPMILKDDRDGRILLDRCWEPAQTRSKIHKLYGPDDKGVVFSQNGLIVVAAGRCSDKESVFIIYNPIYRDVVSIKVPTQLYQSKVCGVFYHPVQKEFCTLWQKILSLEPCKVQFRVLNLESNPQWRDICTQNVKILEFQRVLMIDKYLYWIIYTCQRIDSYSFNFEIMEYDIIKEEFRVIPCPLRVKDFGRNLNLVNNDGVLSLMNVVPNKESVGINILTLNDGGEQLWTSCNYVVSNEVYTGYRMAKAIAFRNGELVLDSNGRLYVCNLEFGTFRKFGRKFGRSFEREVKFLPHVMSLVSLKNCKSNICMAYEDENN